MKALKGSARPARASGDAVVLAIRNLQVAHAVATAAERAATHDLIEGHCLADVLVAIVLLVERGLEALDHMKARP